MLNSARINSLAWLALLLWAVTLVIRYWDAAGLDLSALYFAAKFFGDGFASDVYSTGDTLLGETPTVNWLMAGAAEGLEEHELTPYVYPPLWAALFSPLASNIGLRPFLQGGLLVLVPSLLVLIHASWRLSGRGIAWALWVLISVLVVELTAPFGLALDLMQPQILISALIVLAFAKLRENAWAVAGACLALAAALKGSPALLVVVLLFAGHWRAIAVFAAVGGGLGLLSILIAGWPLHLLFLERLALLDDAALLSRVNLSLQPIVALLLSGELSDPNAGYAWLKAPSWLSYLSLGITLTGLALGGLACRRGAWVLGLSLAWTAVLLASPLAWTHYAILPLCFVPALIGVFSNPRIGQVFVLAIVLASSKAFFAQLVGQPLYIAAIYGSAAALLAFVGLTTCTLRSFGARWHQA